MEAFVQDVRRQDAIKPENQLFLSKYGSMADHKEFLRKARPVKDAVFSFLVVPGAVPDFPYLFKNTLPEHLDFIPLKHMEPEKKKPEQWHKNRTLKNRMQSRYKPVNGGQ